MPPIQIDSEPAAGAERDHSDGDPEGSGEPVPVGAGVPGGAGVGGGIAGPTGAAARRLRLRSPAAPAQPSAKRRRRSPPRPPAADRHASRFRRSSRSGRGRRPRRLLLRCRPCRKSRRLLRPRRRWRGPSLRSPRLGQAQRSGHRGLWMALGGLIVLVLLAGAAIQGPRWYRTWAGRARAVRRPSPPGDPRGDAGKPLLRRGNASRQRPCPHRPCPRRRLRQPRHARQPSGRRPPGAPESGQPPSEPAQPSLRRSRPRLPRSTTRRLEELRDRLGASARAPTPSAPAWTTWSASSRPRATGCGATSRRPGSAWSTCSTRRRAALNAGNADRAQKNLDLAEQEADKLDKFLGR